MPAEKVFGAPLPPIEGEDEWKHECPIVDVRWSRDYGRIQIVTKAEDPAGGRVAGDSQKTHVSDGYYVDLDDRRAINQLIRNLRRARDQAFGRDE